MNKRNAESEWLETDQLGGYSSGTSNLIPTRRYHALYVSADTHSHSRHVLLAHPLAEVKVLDAWHALSSFQFADGTIHPKASNLIESFTHSPWPTWTFKIGDTKIRFEILLLHRRAEGILRWTVLKKPVSPITLRVRPFLTFRDHHSLQLFKHADLSFKRRGNHYTFSKNDTTLDITLHTEGKFHQEPDYYNHFLYQEERNRGYDHNEDLFTPGYFLFESIVNSAEIHFYKGKTKSIGRSAKEICSYEIKQEQTRREKFDSRRTYALSQFEVDIGSRASLIAGYPWFSEWGRDTFISVRGISAATGDYSFAKKTLLSWRETIQHGLIPNRFPDTDSPAEFNSVDATLWYLIVLGELFSASAKNARLLTQQESQLLLTTAETIFSQLQKGTLYQIGMDVDCLLRAGVEGKQLTWMDAKVGDWVVTPRIGKPVEIQALWINALLLFEGRIKGLGTLATTAKQNFIGRFWLSDLGYLADVVDVNHEPSTTDISLRPNQILALGGLPYSLVSPIQSAHTLKIIERDLLTPFGLRTLAQRDTRYHGSYSGDQKNRDSAYHQGTVWPWLIGPFIEAWLRIQGFNQHTRDQAHRRFLAPLLEHSKRCGGHIQEIFDADRPHHARGAPFQAWSLSEVCRIESLLKPRSNSLFEKLRRMLGL